MSSTKSSPQRHVAAIVFPFGSHVLPVLNLVHKLANALPDTHFSFFSVAKSDNFLSKVSKDQLPSNIKFYDVDDGFPKDHVSSGNLMESIELFIKATPDNIKKGFETAAAETNLNICCIIAEVFLTFAGAMAEEMGVPCIPVFGASPYSLSLHVNKELTRQFYFQVINDKDNNDKGTLEKIPGLSQIHVADLPLGLFSTHESPFASMVNKIGDFLKQSRIIVISYLQELYPPSLLSELKSMCPKLLNLGFLTLPVPAPQTGTPPLQSPSDIDPKGCLSWLDGQKPLSVAYISFGIVATLPPTESVELAEALEATGVPFIWSLKDEMKQFLPNQFIERTKKQGMVVPWAPQNQVLAHPSVGVFLTQFGSNSVAESIANGVPMIGRPMYGDHHINGRIVEEVQGIGVKLDANITKEKIIKSLELVLVQEQGKEIRTKAQALKELHLKASGPNSSAIQDFKSLVEEISKL